MFSFGYIYAMHKFKSYFVNRGIHANPSSQVVLLPPRSCVLVQMPLDVALLVVQRAGPDLEETHAHPRPDLCQLHRLVSCLDEDVVADLNGVFDVLESVWISFA